MKCFACEGKEVVKVFINKRGTKHYYCKNCAKKYIVKIVKKKTLEEKR